MNSMNFILGINEFHFWLNCLDTEWKIKKPSGSSLKINIFSNPLWAALLSAARESEGERSLKVWQNFFGSEVTQHVPFGALELLWRCGRRRNGRPAGFWGWKCRLEAVLADRRLLHFLGRRRQWLGARARVRSRNVARVGSCDCYCFLAHAHLVLCRVSQGI